MKQGKHYVWARANEPKQPQNHPGIPRSGVAEYHGGHGKEMGM